MNPSPSIWLQHAIKKSKIANHRGFVVLSGERSSCWALIDEMLGKVTASDVLSYHVPENSPVRSLQLKRATDFLGTNNDCIIFDAWGGFDPDAFGIISGTVNGGGVAILVTPPLPDWPNYLDPENSRLAIHPLTASAITGHYISRITRIISEELPAPVTFADVDCRLLTTSSTCLATPQELPNSEQRALIGTIKDAVSQENRTHAPILITADRGRGKSTGIGLAAAELLNENKLSNIIITAPGKRSLSCFFKHVDNALEPTDTLRPKFIPTDVLLKNAPEADLLLIDEAAAIPLPLLMQLINTYPHCVLSSTMHGYEGAGRGYALRLRTLLNKDYPNWQEFQLTQPARFAQHDPLEEFTAKLLMLNASDFEIELPAKIDIEKCQLLELTSTTLANDETKLSSVYALLVQAHYQTKPLDLKHMLDGPNIRIFTLMQDDCVLAAVLLAHERIADDEHLQKAIIHGERRPRGHLLSQQLSYQYLEKDYLNLSLGRIIRIAVAPQKQGNRVGSVFLEKLFEYCKQGGFDAMGASFGASVELLNFWHKNKFQTLHLGHKQNASSASYSAVVFRSISDRAQKLSDFSHKHFLQALRFRDHHIQDTSLTTSLLSSVEFKTPVRVNSFTTAVVSSYTFRQRDFESSHPQLYSYLCRVELTDANISTLQLQVLESIVLQCKSWSETSKVHKLQGRKDCENVIKAALIKILLPD